MKSIRNLSIVIAVALASAVTIHALADDQPTSASTAASTPFDGSSHPILSAIVRNVLNFRHDTPLSAEQKRQIAGILAAHRAEIRTQIEEDREARRAMHDAVETGGPTSPAATSAAAKVGDAARDRALLVARIGAEIKPVLTPEQQKRIEDAIKDVESTVDTTLAQ